MWQKLEKLVLEINEIPACYKEKFINIVGNKVAQYRNQKYPRRYKAQKLPVAVYQKHPELSNDNYHTILYFNEEKLKPILISIFEANFERWFITGG